ncbi:invasion-associated locus B family protein [Microvirga sp. KLBC 81]|uniref:invasion associated locus B family protein n=1 Tax=Microvirga sp. KLBC 81 TaxID=1862707 RepID=UPI000D51B5D4|nr:invasion associated locus B family protein [Microvirga sp. KLBC 81]PVE23173.1 invasion-associated locus B family protein [Microvirga sp. KLBC 81]
MSFTSRLAGSAIATVLALSAGPGLAQTSGQAPKAKSTAPKAQQAQPQQTQPQQAENAGPVAVALKAEPSQPEWTKVCGKDEAAKAEICYTTRDFVTDKGQRVVAVALYDVKGKASQKLMRIMMPLGFLVPPGVRIVVDKSQPVGGRYASCLPNGCFVEAVVKDDFVAALKKGTTLTISARNQAGREVAFAVPAEGFGKAFDGPPVDPKVLAEQQKKVQEELQKQAEELRNRRRMGNFGNPAQAPADGNAAATQPKN